MNKKGVRDVPVLENLFEEESGETSGDVGVSNASMQKGGAKKEEAPANTGTPTPPRQTKRTKKGRAVSADRIKSKSLFRLESFDPPTSKEELQEWYLKIRDGVKKLERDQAALKKREYELRLREADLEERRKSIDTLKGKIELALEDLKMRRAQFESDITILKEAEKKNIKRQAETLAGMEAKAASDLLLEIAVQKENLAVKLLVSMESELASKIIAEMDRAKGARLIERATRLIQR